MLAFIIGLMVGGIVGFFAFCLLTAGKDSDRYEEYEARRFSEESHITSVEDAHAEGNRAAKAINSAQEFQESDRV